MKKIVLYIVLSFPLWLQAQEGDFTLTGRIGHLNAPAMVSLSWFAGDGSMKDSALLVNGKFSLSGHIGMPVKATLALHHPPSQLKGKMDVIQLYLEKGQLSIVGEDSLNKAVVTGGPVNADYQRLKNMVAPVSRSRDSLYAAWLAFIRANPGSPVSVDVLESYGGMLPADINKVDSLFHTLSAGLRESTKGKAYGTLIANWKRTAIGADAPVFVQNDTVGKPVSLAGFRGKYVLLDFWASWCGPCRAENPHVVKAFNKYKDRGFTILSVSLDRANAHTAWLQAIHKDSLTWTHVSDLKFWDNEVAKLYAVRGIPQNFLISPEGKIVAKNLRGDELEKELQKYLHP